MSRRAMLCACATLALAVTACPPAERAEPESEGEQMAETNGAESAEAADGAAAEEAMPAGQAAGEAPAGAASADPQAERRAVMDLDREWSARAGQGDVSWIANLHAQDARTLPPNAEPVVGREAIRSFWRDLSSTEGLSLSWQPDGARVSDGADMAYSWGSYTMRLPDGAEDRGKYLAVWVREAGDWKVAADMFNSNLPSAPEGAPQEGEEGAETEGSSSPEG